MSKKKIGLIADIYNTCVIPLNQVLENIPAEHFNWKPAPESRSIKEIMLHLIRVDNSFLNKLNIIPGVDAPRDISETEILPLMKQHQAYMLSLLQNLADDKELFTNKISDDIPETMDDIFIHIPQHYLYHLSQVVYLRRANDRIWNSPLKEWEQATYTIAKYLKY